MSEVTDNTGLGFSGHRAGSRCPHITYRIQADHGILTGESESNWTEDFKDLVHGRFPGVLVDTDHYFELPFPRIAAIRNPKRARKRAEKILACAPDKISFVSHSNGGVLSLQTARILIAEGVAVDTMVLIAPALRAPSATREIADWIERGMLRRAVLVRPMKDKVLGFASRRRIITWPWGSLGIDGWDNTLRVQMGNDYGPMGTVDVANVRHSDLINDYRTDTFEKIVLPLLGLTRRHEDAKAGPDDQREARP